METVRPTAKVMAVGLETLLQQGVVTPTFKPEYTMRIMQNTLDHVDGPVPVRSSALWVHSQVKEAPFCRREVADDIWI
jgi:hypothetical protein